MPNRIKLSFDRRIGNWIVNCCIAVAVIAAWSVEKWPASTMYALAAVVAASGISGAVLLVINLREKAAERDSSKSANQELFVARPTYRTMRDEERESAYKYALLFAKKRYQPRSAEKTDQLLRLVKDQLTHSMFERNVDIFAAYYSALTDSAHLPDAGHVKLSPTTERYSVTIGAVRIDVSGDETKVTINDNKKVIINAPTQNVTAEQVTDEKVATFH